MSNILVGSYADSLYDTYAADSQTTGASLQSKLKSKDMSGAGDDELMEACREFEAYFVEQVFKEMEKTADAWRDEENGSSSKYRQYAEDTLRTEYAASASKGDGLGLAKMLYEQMKRNYNVD